MNKTLPLFSDISVENIDKDKQDDLEKVYYDIEMPLIPVLMYMEKRGILIDKNHLENLSRDIKEKISATEGQIYHLTGRQFNINSSQQLSEVLFEKLKLKPVQRTKTGFSTDVKTLEKLSFQHQVIPLILKYRHFEKLLNTYIEPLPLIADFKTGRVHTSYNQAVTTTGRLSSSNPNLQNIPTRSDYGQEIRKAFVASPGYKLVSLDYSQIELRLVAAFSGDQKMISDFAEDKDIHSSTAQRIFKLSSLDEVNREQRSIAKAINFATIYGAGARTLSENAQIKVAEAKQFLEEYFNQYPTVQQYSRGLVEKAETKGYAETFFGRMLILPDINSHIFQLKAAAERVAMNMPLQGTAADIMKLAMIKAYKFIENKDPEIFMLLQVHDELVFEIKEEKVKEYSFAIREIMEKVIDLTVYLKVDLKYGSNWGEMEIL